MSVYVCVSAEITRHKAQVEVRRQSQVSALAFHPETETSVHYCARRSGWPVSFQGLCWALAWQVRITMCGFVWTLGI